MVTSDSTLNAAVSCRRPALLVDGARVGGVNELFAIIAMAAKFGVPVCPHSGGIGLGQMVGPMSAFDQAWFGSDGRWL